MGGHFDALLDVWQSFGFQYAVMCDRDALLTIVQKLDYKNEKIKVSRIFYNLGKRLETTDLKELENIQSKILPVTDQRGYEVFSDECFELLKNIVLRYNIFTLSSDFEGVLEQKDIQSF